MKFTNKLREYRMKRGWTQEELSQKADVSRATIAGIESGAISTTTTNTLLKLSNTLNAPVSKIFFT